MDPYILDWFNLIIRWTHVIVGIAWIGSSFYFVWLDTNLNSPPRDPENDDVAGDLWAVHGGGFYHTQKYKIAPAELPEPLHWFKWEAYSTWLTGFLMLIVLYYANADVYLVDKNVADISANAAILISIGSLIVGWLLYDFLCKSLADDRAIALIGFLLVVVLTWGISQLFGGRGAYMQVGVVLGTIMVANVFFNIIPSQKQLVAAKLEGREPDAEFGKRAKQRSMHNSYLTLPVVFVMLSTHHPMTYGHPYAWLVLITLFIVGAIIRHYFNLRNQGKNIIVLPAVAIIILILLAISIAPAKPAASSNTAAAADAANRTVSFDSVKMIIEARCTNCHSSNPTHPTAAVAPNGVVFDELDDILKWSERIYDRVVVTKTMPLANLTSMTNAERELIGAWFKHGISRSQP